MKSRSNIPSKDKLSYTKPALTQRSNCLLQSLIHASLKERSLCIRKGHALNAPNDPFSIKQRSKQDLPVMRQWISKVECLYKPKFFEHRCSSPSVHNFSYCSSSTRLSEYFLVRLEKLPKHLEHPKRK